MSTSPIGRWAGVAAAILPSRRAAKLNMMSGPGAGGSPWKKWSEPARTRAWRVFCLAAAVVVVAPVAAARAASAAGHPGRGHLGVVTTVLPVPSGGPEMGPSEPHIAVDPNDPAHLFAVAQVGPGGGAPATREFLWRSGDGGTTWTRSPLLGGSGNTPAVLSGDPTVAAGRHGLVLYGTLTADVDAAAGTLTQQAGTRVSTDGGASFTAFGSAKRSVLPLCFIALPCTEPPPPGSLVADKPWLAVDATGGAFDGAAYLVWDRLTFDTAIRYELLVSVSTDQGRTYGPPVVLDRQVLAGLAGLAHNSQVAVRPDGTVDVVWNGMWHGRPLILHTWSTDGGASFSAPETVVPLRPDASLAGVVASLAVSPRGQLAVCWSQARSPDRNDPRVACTVRARHGGWGPAQAILPGNRQYLPAAAFQGERLWAGAYVSSATSTRLVAVRDEGNHFGQPVTVNRWPVPSERICAPHPPDCLQGQTFIGDYIGMAAAGRRVMVAYIQPSAGPSQPNRLLVSSIRTK
jgi:hypothetical protein